MVMFVLNNGLTPCKILASMDLVAPFVQEKEENGESVEDHLRIERVNRRTNAE